MEQLHWPLHVLSRAVHFKNLSGASAHVGLSQPQLSRLITQIEGELNVTLLDRTARRKSGWTPAAFRLAEVYQQSSRKLQAAIHELVETQMPSEIHIGLLEGLSPIALDLTRLLFENSNLHLIELNVFDQNDLEEKFLNGDLDLCLTSRPPSRQKFKHQIELGYQTFDIYKNSDETQYFVQSPFEYGREKRKKSAAPSEQKYFISNSLALRKQWLTQFKGHGILPGSVKKKNAKDLLPVVLIASELFNESLWKTVTQVCKRLEVE
ncbi:MAG: LysR family transcriptional regulator [Bdellovibrionota bacterium]